MGPRARRSVERLSRRARVLEHLSGLGPAESFKIGSILGERNGHQLDSYIVQLKNLIWKGRYKLKGVPWWRDFLVAPTPEMAQTVGGKFGACSLNMTATS